MSKRVMLALAASAMVPAAAGFGAAAIGAEAASRPAVTAKPACANYEAVQVRAGSTPRCDLNGTDRLDVHYPGSDGIEWRMFTRRCNRVGGQLWWRNPGGVPGAGHFVCEDVDF